MLLSTQYLSLGVCMPTSRMLKENKNYFYVGNLLFRCKFVVFDADVAELVDALDLGSSAARCGGSSPSIRTQFISI